MIIWANTWWIISETKFDTEVKTVWRTKSSWNFLHNWSSKFDIAYLRNNITKTVFHGIFVVGQLRNTHCGLLI